MAIADLGLKPEQVPDLLLPYQKRWVADRSGFKLWSKSRRIGASWCEAGDCALLAARTQGQDVFYIAYEKEMTRQFCLDAADWAKSYALVASEIEESEEVWRDGDEDKSIQVFRIWFDSSHRIEALSSAPRNLRSKQGRVVIDEAAFHDDLPGLLKAAKALRLWGSSIHVITTYNGVDEPYCELEQDVLAGKFPYARHFTDFRAAIAEGLYQRICLMQGKDWSQSAQEEWVEQTYAEFGDDALEELDCIPSQSGGAYLSRAVIEQCMSGDIPVLKLSCDENFVTAPQEEREARVEAWITENLAPLLGRLDPNLKSCFGMDFGRFSDLSVVLPLQERPNLVRHCPFALELRNVPHEQQRQVLFWLCDRLPRFVSGAMDAGGNGHYLSEVALQKYGASRIHQIYLNTNWYAENFPRYKAALQDREILLPKSSDWLDDHRMVALERGVPKIPDKKNKGTDGQKRHADSAIAGVLAWFASLNGGSEIEFEALGQIRGGYQLGDYVEGSY